MCAARGYPLSRRVSTAVRTRISCMDCNFSRSNDRALSAIDMLGIDRTSQALVALSAHDI